MVVSAAGGEGAADSASAAAAAGGDAGGVFCCPRVSSDGAASASVAVTLASSMSMSECTSLRADAGDSARVEGSWAVSLVSAASLSSIFELVSASDGDWRLSAPISGADVRGFSAAISAVTSISSSWSGTAEASLGVAMPLSKPESAASR